MSNVMIFHWDINDSCLCFVKYTLCHNVLYLSGQWQVWVRSFWVRTRCWVKCCFGCEVLILLVLSASAAHIKCTAQLKCNVLTMHSLHQINLSQHVQWTVTPNDRQTDRQTRQWSQQHCLQWQPNAYQPLKATITTCQKKSVFEQKSLLKIQVYWDITTCWLVNGHQRFGAAYCNHLQGISSSWRVSLFFDPTVHQHCCDSQKRCSDRCYPQTDGGHWYVRVVNLSNARTGNMI